MPANPIDIINIILLVLFFSLLFSRILLLKSRGIQPIVFAKTHPSDYFLMPIMFLLVYVALASALPILPFIKFLLNPLVESNVLTWIGIFISSIGVVAFALSLISFGNSFRMGIDTEKPDKLITTGIFSVSRNPMYTAFIFFFLGLILAHPNIAFICVLFGLYIPILHRQIIREEDFLKKHYGGDYSNYAKKVRRYL